MALGQEVNLRANYPKTKRDLATRIAEKTDEDRRIAREFGEAFFDGDRRHGYGGFHYHPRFWQPVIPTIQEHFGLTAQHSVLDVGCAKGFMIHDMAELIPGITVKGVDISEYAIENAIEDMRPHVQVANAKELPFEDKSFDFVISIQTLHNLERVECAQAVQEVERVSRLGSYISLDAYRDKEEEQRMFAWDLTALTIMHAEEWKAFLKKWVILATTIGLWPESPRRGMLP